MSKNGKPVVSIVVPVYQAERYLSECIDSIRRQTYDDIEIILVNDGSFDHSGEIIEKYVKKDPRVRAIHRENGGVSEAKNSGISAAIGEYITFIDSDDYIRKDFIENLLEDALKYKVDIVSTGTGILPIKQDSLENVEVYNRYEAYNNMFYGTLEKSENGMQLFKRSLIQNNSILFDPLKKIGEDFDFFVNALRYCDDVAVDYRKMYYYRPNPSSAMNQAVNKGLMDAVENFASLGEQLIVKYPDLRPAVEAKKFGDSVSLLIRSYKVQKEWPKEIKALKANVTTLKYKVALDKNAKKKVRIVALLYGTLGNNIATALLRRVKS